MDEVLARGLTNIFAPHVTPSRFMRTKSGEIRGIGEIVKHRDGREYVVFPDGSWRRKDKLDAKQAAKEGQ